MPAALLVCLGAIGAGKTTLLKKIQNQNSTKVEVDVVEESGLPPQPLPTVGINHFDINCMVFRMNISSHSILS